jgi:predicted nucleotidyltransferase
MIKVKVNKIETPFKTFKYQNWIISTDYFLCSKCKQPIKQNEIFYLCSDFNTVLHENCYNPKEHFNFIIKDKNKDSKIRHIDWLCKLLIIYEDKYNGFDLPELELNI